MKSTKGGFLGKCSSSRLGTANTGRGEEEETCYYEVTALALVRKKDAGEGALC